MSAGGNPRWKPRERVYVTHAELFPELETQCLRCRLTFAPLRVTDTLCPGCAKLAKCKHCSFRCVYAVPNTDGGWCGKCAGPAAPQQQ